MKLSQIAEILNAQVLCLEENLDIEIPAAVASDMMSDVLVCNDSDRILISGLCTVHTVLTAQILDLRAIIFVRGKTPTDEIIESAQLNDIVLMRTEKSMFDVCGMLYAHGIDGRRNLNG
ncbi:MAG: hypothetical protein IJF80_03245 [Clostridia bacterium]|nr:hypothetical protein [Clostridia bacterium]